MASVLQNIKSKYGTKVEIDIIDITKDKSYEKNFKISGVPFVVIYDKNGKVIFVNDFIVQEEKISNILKEMGVEP